MGECEPEYGAFNTLIPKAATMNRINQDKGCIEQETRFSQLRIEEKIINIRKLRKLEKLRKARKDTEKIRGP